MDEFEWSGFCDPQELKHQLQHHHRASSISGTDSAGWFDELYDATAATTTTTTTSGSSQELVKLSHRRAVSDTLAFLDPPLVNASLKDNKEDQHAGPHAQPGLLEQHVHDSSGKPTAPERSPTGSDTNSGGNDGATSTAGFNDDDFASLDPNLDPKRARRIIANRQSAQRSRIRKLQYIAELEKNVTNLQMEVSALTPQVSFLDHQRVLLNVDNSVMKQRIAALVQNVRLKDAHNEALRKEAERLRGIYHQQQLEFQHQQRLDVNELESAESLSPFFNGVGMIPGSGLSKSGSRGEGQSSYGPVVQDQNSPLSLSLKF